VAVNRWLYGALFVVVLPALLVLWAVATDDVVPFRALPYPWAGSILVGFAVVLMLGGVWALWEYGRGLPMNPYPPPLYVVRGIYRYLAHPIYVGFVLLCVGVAVAAQSASGLWLVSPVVALACAALVLGFERHDLRRRFDADRLRRPRISLPADTDEKPTGWDRFSVFVLVLIPWTLAFEGVYWFGVPPDAIEAYLPFERRWPVIEWTEAIYAGVYVLVPGSVFVVRTRAALRRFAVTGLIATAAITLVYLTVPLVAPPRSFEPQSALGRALMFERSMANTVAAFPAFHVIWTFIAAEAWATRGRGVAVAVWVWAILITVSCLTTGMHALADVVAGVVAFLVIRNHRLIWEMLRRGAERIANSWREWRIGGVRFLGYGLYALLGGAVGFTIAAGAAGPDAFWQLVLVHFAGLIGAGLWAQKLEGSSKLSRPFGYYGAVLGAVGTTIVAGVVGGNTMLLLAAIALAAPWIQAIGRARCLMQGCCHGSEASESVGIRYWREQSRVTYLAGLRGVPLHPTPLYSMLANAVTWVILLRLWSLDAPLSLIAGAYFMLTGVARFVEESYRGEPQTPVVGGLRIYQWLAILSLVAGAVLTTLPSGAAPGLPSMLDVRVLVGALGFGTACGLAMGADFPSATGRYTRLAPP
jgi:protein-S-isoprenylcysteine O-methyltransferase Ste14